MLTPILLTVPVSDRGSVKLIPIKSLDFHNLMQVIVTGVKLEAVKALVELIYKGICNLEQVFQYSLAKQCV